MYPLHHALLYCGHQAFSLADFLVAQQKEFAVITQKYTEFRINDARNLIILSNQTPINYSKQIFVIITQTIAIDAQNALLKLIEEPPSVTTFVFVMANDSLLPTLRSRFFLVPNKTVPKLALAAEFCEFLHSSIPDRLIYIALLIAQKDFDTLHRLERELNNYLLNRPIALSNIEVKHLHWLLVLLPKRGSSHKLLWEEVSFVLPVAV